MIKQIEIDCEVIAETVYAIKIFDGKIECWIPKSAVTDQSENDKGVTTSIFISEYLATEKGLV